MIDFNEIIEYNKEMLIDYYYHLCKTNIDSNICRKVTENTLETWKTYIDKNQFLKGMDRLETWRHLAEDKPFIYIKNNSMYKFIPPKNYQYLNVLNNLKKESLYFVLASLIIIFQVFGDGNHRTAHYFYYKMTNKHFTPKQLSKIDEVLKFFDYGGEFERNPEIINEIIGKLVDIQEQTGGKKRKYKTLHFRHKKNKTKKLRYHNKIQKKYFKNNIKI